MFSGVLDVPEERFLPQEPVKKSHRRGAKTAEIAQKSKEKIVAPAFISCDLGNLCASAVSVVPSALGWRERVKPYCRQFFKLRYGQILSPSRGVDGGIGKYLIGVHSNFLMPAERVCQSFAPMTESRFCHSFEAALKFIVAHAVVRAQGDDG
jgi:hypothetical protein